ncbi:hypothetical protein EJB05_47962, partial [Eragrostis curvula]
MRPAEAPFVAKQAWQGEMLGQVFAGTSKQKHDKSKGDLVDLISKEGEDLRVIAVWGTSGDLGMASIVNAAYENPSIKKKFSCRAWARVMHPFNPSDFVHSLVKQFRSAEGVDILLETEKTGQELAEEFSRYVNERSYLIVLNDLSTFEEWNEIKICFPNNMKGSRIILCTPQVEVASLCAGQESLVLELKQLSVDQTIYAFYERDRTKLSSPTSRSNEATTSTNNNPMVPTDAIRRNQSKGGDGRKEIPKSITRIKTIASALEESQLIGREREKYDIVKLISNQPNLKLSVISVWGMGGIGKTTLIKDVFQTQKLSGMFEKRACVTVMRPFILKDLLERLITQLNAESSEKKASIDLMIGTGSKTSMMGVEELTKELSRILKGKKCLIVLDDVSSNGEWDHIIQCFPKFDNTCLIVVTTREESIAKHCSVKHENIYKLKVLAYDDALELFTKKFSFNYIIFGKWRSFYISDKMRLLRVLDLEGTSGLLDHDIVHIGKLLHLRYLSLRGCEHFYHLPDSLGNLRQLQTLDVMDTNITKLPATITKLRKLQYLHCGDTTIDDDDTLESTLEDFPKPMQNKLCFLTVLSTFFCVFYCAPQISSAKPDIERNRHDVYAAFCCAFFPFAVGLINPGCVVMPGGIWKMKALQTLGIVNLARGEVVLQGIRRLTNLRKLGVAGVNMNNSEEFCFALADLWNLESLLVWSKGKPGLCGCLDGLSSPPKKLQSLKLYGNLVKLPEWIQGLHNLVKLSLRSSRISEHDAAMQVLGELPNLTIMRLLENSFQGEELCLSFPLKAFPSLTVLEMDLRGNIKSVKFEERARTEIEETTSPEIEERASPEIEERASTEIEEAASPKLELIQFRGSTDQANAGLFSGLASLPSLKEFILQNNDVYKDDFLEDVQAQLAQNPSGPVLKRI